MTETPKPRPPVPLAQPPTELEAMCTTKRPYRSPQGAARAGDQAYRQRGVRLRVYACPYCGQFHLTKHDPI